jgi:hypothetical protein
MVTHLNETPPSEHEDDSLQSPKDEGCSNWQEVAEKLATYWSKDGPVSVCIRSNEGSIVAEATSG